MPQETSSLRKEQHTAKPSATTARHTNHSMVAAEPVNLSGNTLESTLGLSLVPRTILFLQRQIGNHALSQMLNTPRTPSKQSIIQRALDGSMRADVYDKGGFRAVKLTRDVGGDRRKDTEWWISEAQLTELQEARGAEVAVSLESGDGDGMSPSISINDITYTATEAETDKAKEEERKRDADLRGKFEAAVAAHEADRTAVETVLDGAAASGDVMLKNSVEMIKKGDTTLIVVTPTHDSDERVTKAKEGADKTAYFGSDVEGEAAAEPYRWYNPSDQYDVFFHTKNAAGMNVDGKIYLCSPALWETMGVTTTIAATIKHETQHGVDMNAREGDVEGWRQYKTEYRAYLAAGEYAAENDVTKDQSVKGVAGFTKRQSSIANHILTHYDDAKKAWEDNADVSVDGEEKKFREAVVGFHGTLNALSINPINSKRLMKLQDEALAMEADDNADSRDGRDLIRTFTRGEFKLDAQDKAVIAANGALTALMTKHLHPTIIARLQA